MPRCVTASRDTSLLRPFIGHHRQHRHKRIHSTSSADERVVVSVKNGTAKREGRARGEQHGTMAKRSAKKKVASLDSATSDGIHERK